MTEQSLLRRDMSAYSTEEDSTSEQGSKVVERVGSIILLAFKSSFSMMWPLEQGPCLGVGRVGAAGVA